MITLVYIDTVVHRKAAASHPNQYQVALHHGLNILIVEVELALLQVASFA